MSSSIFCYNVLKIVCNAIKILYVTAYNSVDNNDVEFPLPSFWFQKLNCESAKFAVPPPDVATDHISGGKSTLGSLLYKRVDETFKTESARLRFGLSPYPKRKSNVAQTRKQCMSLTHSVLRQY